MRDGRAVYDGPPRTHADVHAVPDGPHHPDVHARFDHAPRVASPFETEEDSGR
jgi:hypothetical protein